MDDDKRENPGLVIVEGSVLASTASRARNDDGLNELQTSFIDFYCSGVPAALCGRDEDAPPGDGLAAALAAGYRESGAANMATRNLLKPKIQAEIERRVKMGRGSALLAGTMALFKIMDKGSDERAIVTAATAVLDRFGMAPPKGPATQVNIGVMNGNAAQAILVEVQQRRQQRIAQQSDHADD
ncbi:terminase small subunit [Sphingomonas sp.]|uniref:terminase small subunit n=1 Tax=Sphingomonas sp. TaxID=28214 RepID=UPI0025F063EE|nr:terminase small subunit [Sphingomonas sp.]